MSATMMTTDIAYDYRATGEVLCKNPKGLVFFLRAEPPRVEAPAPKPEAPRTWQPVEATHEVEVKRHAEPQAIAPARGTGPLTDAPAPGQAAQKGWFSKLIGK